MPFGLKRLFSARPPIGGPPHLELGKRGEIAALSYLKEKLGYRIVATNFTVLLGRSLSGKKITGEIDIIAYDQETLVFIEVKARSSGEMAAPEAAVGLKKQRQIARAARRYRHLMRVAHEQYRYDVITVLTGESGLDIQLMQGYFDDGVFLRGRYFARDREYN
jgi:putative endonuclease